MKIDLTTEFGRRVAHRLQDEQIIWLTTVDSRGAPQPRPVWFLWDEDSFLIYSQPNTHKLRHIREHPQVALNFDGDGDGGDIVVITGHARIDEETPAADRVLVYIAKYREGIRRIQMTVASFATNYSVPLRVTPTDLRGH